MPEAKRPPISEHAGGRECVGRPLRRGLRQPGELGGQAGGDVVAEDSDRSSQSARGGFEARHHRAGESLGRSSAMRGACSAVGSMPSVRNV